MIVEEIKTQKAYDVLSDMTIYRIDVIGGGTSKHITLKLPMDGNELANSLVALANAIKE